MTTRRFINDPNSPSSKRALALARADEGLHAKLLHARALQGLTQTDVAEIMGVSQPTVASFERYENDPKLSTVRRYAHAVGVTIAHTVLVDGHEIDCGWTHVGDAEFHFVAQTRKVASHPASVPALTITHLPMAA